MATKQQAINALKKHCDQAMLIDEHPPTGYQVQLEAPKGHHWDGDVHCRAVDYWYNGGKADYWELVIEEIKTLPNAVPCTDSDCEGIAAWGVCEYWEEE